MSRCLSNATFSHPFFSSLQRTFSNPRFSQALHIDYKHHGQYRIKAMAPPKGRAHLHLDHLQKAHLDHLEKQHFDHQLEKPHLDHHLQKPHLGHLEKPHLDHHLEKPGLDHHLEKPHLDHLQKLHHDHLETPHLDHLQKPHHDHHLQKPHLDHHLQKPEKPQPKRKLPHPAPIGLWDRFPTARTVQQMMETMDRLIEDPFAFSKEFSPSPIPPEHAAAGGYSRGRTPWEIKEGETEYMMRFDMPGMTKEDVKVWVEEKMLVLKGEKEPKKKGANGIVGREEEQVDWSPKSYGRYSCRIALPENVQFEKIKAEVKDGVLYISIPKDEVSAKILDINVE